MKKKILVVSFNFWPENFPINEFTKYLSIKKCAITVLTGKPNYPLGQIFNGYSKYFVEREIYFKKISILRVPIIPRGSGNFVMRILNYFSFVFSALIFGSFYLRNKKFDHIYVYGTTPIIHSFVGIFFKYFKKAKLSIWLQDLLPINALISGYIKNLILLRIIEYFINFIYKKSDYIFIQSKFFIHLLKNKVPSNKIFYLPNFSPKILKLKKIKINNYNKNKFNICYFGNLGLVQEFNTLIKTAKRINNQNINFHLFGEGISKKNIENEIKIKKIRNFFIHDYLNPKYLRYLLNQSSVLFVSLKKNKYLNFIAPSKLQLYMLSKKPLLGEISGEGKRIINESGAGVIVKQNSVNDMINKINYLYKIKNTKEIKEFGISSFKYSKINFDIKILVKNFLKIIR